MADTPLLDRIKRIEDIRTLTPDQLMALAVEVRTEMIEIVSLTGGHLGAGLGVVELTVALHHVFETPHDRLIWDVGHQAYPHKILTGRRDRMPRLRQSAGLSGFTKRSESIFDPFGAGHSSTSISAALGIQVASDLKGETRHVIAVIGDGAMSAGMAFEAINNAGVMDNRLIVILNDNDMSIDPPTGAVSAYLARLRQRDPSSSEGDPSPFETLGFDYIGPIDGHDMEALLQALKKARNHDSGPVLVHVKSQKGKGYAPAENAADKYHGVSRFDVTTGAQIKSNTTTPSYTSIFAKSLIAEAKKDERIVAITAAMPSGTGIGDFAKIFPDRSFDVGIAEQHAVTFAAGLAAEGLKPFCALYSTFLQRAYDQLVHDVAIQNLPVRFPIDRAGFVGADGATHAGAFDIAFLANLPNMVVMAASDEAELMHMVATASNYEDGPIAFRYPRGEGTGVKLPREARSLSIGKGRIIKEASSSKIAILSLGARLGESLKAAEQLDHYGLPTSVADARFAKPLDRDLILKLAGEHEMLITIEEGVSGGFGAQVLHFLSAQGALDGSLKVRSLVMDDRFTEQGKPEAMYAANGLDAQTIVEVAFGAFGRELSEAIEHDEMA